MDRFAGDASSELGIRGQVDNAVGARAPVESIVGGSTGGEVDAAYIGS